MNPDILQELLMAAGLAIVSVVGWGLRELIKVGVSYLKARLGSTQYEQLRAFAGTVVRAVEQSPIYQDFAGEKKKELVKVAVLQFAEEHSLPIDEALLEKFIEAAVQEMNSQMSKIDWVAAELLSGDDALSVSAN